MMAVAYVLDGSLIFADNVSYCQQSDGQRLGLTKVHCLIVGTDINKCWTRGVSGLLWTVKFRRWAVKFRCYLDDGRLVHLRWLC